MWHTWEHVGGAPVFFVWLVQHLSTSKNTLSPCHWNHCRVLFLLVRCVSPVVIQFGVGMLFFFSFFSLFSFKNYNLTLLVVSISTLVLFIHLIFGFGPFIDVLFVFNFTIQSKFTKYYILKCGPYSLNFQFFSLVFL